MTIQLNKIYLSKGGETFKPVKLISGSIVADDNGNQWMCESGEFLSCYEEGNPYFDLITEVEPCL